MSEINEIIGDALSPIWGSDLFNINEVADIVVKALDEAGYVISRAPAVIVIEAAMP